MPTANTIQYGLVWLAIGFLDLSTVSDATACFSGRVGAMTSNGTDARREPAGKDADGTLLVVLVDETDNPYNVIRLSRRSRGRVDLGFLG